MRSFALPTSLLSLACLLLSAPAWSGPNDNEINPTVNPHDIARALADRDRPFFFGGTGGIGWVNATHPDLVASSSFTSAMIGVHAGYTISPQWAVAIELTTVEEPVQRSSPQSPFSSVESVEPQGCFLCPTLPGDVTPAQPGELVAITAIFGTLGPRVEYTPFGPDGLYVSGSAGFAFVQNLDARAGVGGAARLGYRLRLAEVLTFSLEGGVQAQGYADASMVMPYAALLARPYF